jgi:7-keto-8-aminopelargonate synthetase-like enzyme
VDAVFSMEGDVIDLPHVVRLCKKHGAILMIDEAHSLGVIGKTGRGIQEYFNMTPTDIDVKMGCLSKTLASCGGFIAGRSQLIRYLRHHARGYLFSSALPASQVAAASVAIDVVLDEPERLDHLWQLRHQYVEGLQKLGLETFGSQTPIVPIACRTEAIALEMTRLCRNAGLYVVPVFYPAVPLNRCRLRTCITASHTNEDIEFALRVLAEAGRAVGLIH